MGNLNEIHPGVDGHIATVNVKDKTNVPRFIQVPQISDADKKHPMMDFFLSSRHTFGNIWLRL